MPVYTLTILVAAGLVVWVYRHDRVEPEPWWALIVAVVVGFAAMWALGLADDYALTWLSLSHEQILARAATIALIEEGGKLGTVLLLACVLLPRQFNDPMDGLIYGRVMGVGMALNESMLYLSLAPPTLQTFGIEIVRLFAHSLMGGLVGFAVGIGSRPTGPRLRYPRLIVLCLALSTTMHFGWNVIAYTRPQGLAAKLIPMGLMLAMMGIWHWFCAIAQKRSEQFFASKLQPAGAVVR